VLLLAGINRSVLVVALSALSRVCKQGHVLSGIASVVSSRVHAALSISLLARKQCAGVNLHHSFLEAGLKNPYSSPKISLAKTCLEFSRPVLFLRVDRFSTCCPQFHSNGATSLTDSIPSSSVMFFLFGVCVHRGWYDRQPTVSGLIRGVLLAMKQWSSLLHSQAWVSNGKKNAFLLLGELPAASQPFLHLQNAPNRHFWKSRFSGKLLKLIPPDVRF